MKLLSHLVFFHLFCCFFRFIIFTNTYICGKKILSFLCLFLNDHIHFGALYWSNKRTRKSEKEEKTTKKKWCKNFKSAFFENILQTEQYWNFFDSDSNRILMKNFFMICFTMKWRTKATVFLVRHQFLTHSSIFA